MFSLCAPSSDAALDTVGRSLPSPTSHVPMTVFRMDPSNDSQEGDASHERPGQSNQHEPWSFDSLADAVAGSSSTATAATPHVSLFSPSVPPILNELSPSPPAGGSGSRSNRPHVNNIAYPSPSRPSPSLGSMASMKRTARLKASDSHAPIVQLHTQIPAVQKSGDDPTTPLENTSRKRTTMDLMPHEQTTMTSLSNLFSESPNSRAPSYNNATGPLYLRGK